MYYNYYLYYLSYFSSLYAGYPLVIRLTAVMVLLLLILTVLGFLRLLFVGYKETAREKKRDNVKAHFEDRLSFVMKNQTNYDIEEVRQLLQYDASKTKSWDPELLTEIILSVKNKLNREGILNEINYKNCLEALRLMGFWEKRIKKSDIIKRREALQVVGKIDNGLNSGVLSKSVFHKNKYLRKTARELFTSYDNYNPFKFMEENFDDSFTQLDKLRLHSALIKRNVEMKLPNLLRWVNNSKNPKYIIFVLQEVAFFKQTESIPTLISMLYKQESKEVRAQIISTLGDLESVDCINDLISLFSLESTIVREAIISTMGKLKTDEALDFLITTYKSTDDPMGKMQIARAIRNHGEKGVNILNNFKQNVESKTKENVLLQHVLAEKSSLVV